MSQVEISTTNSVNKRSNVIKISFNRKRINFLFGPLSWKWACYM